MSRVPWPAQIVIGAALAALLTALWMAALGWVVALGDSTAHRVYRQVYRQVSVTEPGAGPDWVRFTLAHPYLDTPRSVIKQVVCRPGQTLVAGPQGDTCDGRVIARPKVRTLDGRPLTPFVWAGPVPAGRVFVANPHPDSFDSRYFGFVDLSKVDALEVVW